MSAVTCQVVPQIDMHKLHRPSTAGSACVTFVESENLCAAALDVGWVFSGGSAGGAPIVLVLLPCRPHAAPGCCCCS